jgi:hypothetical protein
MTTFTFSGPSASIWFERDPSQRRVLHGWRGDMRGCDLVRAHRAMLDRWPEARCWDMIIDLREGEHAIEAEHVSQLAELYRRRRGDPEATRRVAMVTNDPNFHLWARAMDFQFQCATRHVVFRAFDAAVRYIDEARPEPAPGGLPGTGGPAARAAA